MHCIHQFLVIRDFRLIVSAAQQTFRIIFGKSGILVQLVESDPRSKIICRHHIGVKSTEQQFFLLDPIYHPYHYLMRGSFCYLISMWNILLLVWSFHFKIVHT